MTAPQTSTPDLFNGPTTPSIPVPSPNEHEQRVQDIIMLWNLALKVDQKPQAQTIMSAHPGANADPEKSTIVQVKLRELLGQPLPEQVMANPFDDLFPPIDVPLPKAAAPETIPAPATPQVPPAPVQQPAPVEQPVPTQQPAPAPAPTPAPATPAPATITPNPEAVEDHVGSVENDADDDETTSDDGTNDGEEDDAMDAENTADDAEEGAEEGANPTPAATQPVVATSAGDPSWPAEALGNGLISGLSRTLAHAETLTIILSRNRDQLVATIIPTKGEGEPQETALPLAAKGTPKELDAELAEAIPLYEQSRKTARQCAQELLERTAKAAAAAKNKAASSKTTAGKTTAASTSNQQATVTVSVPKNPGALIHLEGGNGGKIILTSGKATKVAAGTYTLHAVANMMEPKTETLTVKGGETKKIEIKLEPVKAPTLL